MSLIANEQFTGATTVGDTIFTSEVDVNTLLTLGSNQMTIAEGATDWLTPGSISYLVLDSAGSTDIGTRQKSLRCKWDIKLDDASIGGTRLLDMLRLYKATTVVLQTQLRANAGGEAEFVRFIYDDLANGANHTVDSSTFTFNDNTAHTFELEVVMSTNAKLADGTLKLWFDDTQIVNQTGIGWTDEFFDELRFGANNVTFTGAVTLITYDNFQIASNRTFVDQAETFYVSTSGTRAGLGSSSDPFSDLDIASSMLQGGDTLIFVDNGVSNPYRSVEDNSDGTFKLVRNGTAGNLIEVKSDTGNAVITNTINATEGGDYTWTESATAGEYYLTWSDSTTPAFPEKPAFVAKCSAANWTSGGVDNLDATASEGTIGSLSEGEWDYGENVADSLGFNTIYYHPTASEDITTLHIEIPFGQAAAITDTCMNLDVDYYNVHDLKVMFAQHTGIELSANGTGAYLSNIDASKCYVRGIQDNSACTQLFNESHNNLWTDQAGGFLFGNGCTGDKYGLYAYNNQDDGFEVSCGFGQTIDVTLAGCVASNNGIGPTVTDGHGFECTIEVLNQVVNLYNCLAIGNNNNGFHFISPLDDGQGDPETGGTFITANLGAINNGGYGINDATSHAASSTTFATNGLYNNTLGASTGANYDNNGDITTDPGITVDSNGEYTLSSTSSWNAAGTGSATRTLIGRNGEPIANIAPPIGAIQGTDSTNNPFHPLNL